MAGPRDYNTLSEIDPQLFRDIIAGSRNSSTPASPASPTGIMAPSGVNMEEEARRSAEEAAAIRAGMGITESLRGPVSVEDSIVGQVARSMGANADDPESVATAVTTINTDPPRATTDIQAFADMRPLEETLALGAGDQTLAALGRPDPLDMPDREGTTQGFTPLAPLLSIYTVQSGDILATIARRNNTTVEALLQANPDITDPDTIAIGQEITLPGRASTPAVTTTEEAAEQPSEPPVEESDFLSGALDEVLASEGLYQNDVQDTGNYRPDGTRIGTMRGITPNALAAYRGIDANTLTADDMRAVTEEEARAIYRQDYYEQPRIDELPRGIQANVMDMYINAGSNAIRILQDLLGVTQDGVIGNDTLEALGNTTITNDQYADARIAYYSRLAEENPARYARYLNGWTNRANKYRD